MDGKAWLRFWRKVKIGDGCWEWQATKTLGSGKYRYGGFRYENRTYLAHRMAWWFWTADFLKGRDPQLHHKCENTLCVRPDHLELVTPKEHAAKTPGHNVNKDRCPKGHPYSRKSYRGRYCQKCITAAVRRHRQRKKLTSL